MGIPTSEVGYTSATTRRETTKSMTDMWWHWKTTSLINEAAPFTTIYITEEYHTVYMQTVKNNI
jgi:hypothetical protein